MKGVLALFVAGLLAACSVLDSGQALRPAESQADVVASGVICRVGADGGPTLADRGIGGTGSPSGPHSAVHAANRIADRGIGGTGIVGVVTGFASICVNGVEVRYDETVPVDVNGTAASASALRAGQVVVVRADDSALAPRARTISIRNEMAGRIESLEFGSGTLRIAGQPVSVPAGTWGAGRFGLGDWVAVSGFRREDGTVVASRLDAAASGTLAVRGQVVREGDVTRVGSLVLEGPVAKSVKHGQFVTVSGRYVDGQGQVTAVVPDTLIQNPAAYFGHSVDRLIMQGFVRVSNGTIWMNGLRVNAGANAHQQTRPDGIAVVSLERRPGGSYTAVGLRYTDVRGQPDETSQARIRSGRAYASLAPPWSRHTTTLVDHATPGSGSAGPVAPASAPSVGSEVPGAAADGTAASTATDDGSAVAASSAAMTESQSSSTVLTVTVPTSPMLDLWPEPAIVAPAAAPAPAPIVPLPAVAPESVATPQGPAPKSGDAPLISSNGGPNGGGSVMAARAAPRVRTIRTASNTMRSHRITGSSSSPTVSLVTGVVGPVSNRAGLTAAKTGRPVNTTGTRSENSAGIRPGKATTGHENQPAAP